MSISKWIMKQYWRVGTIRALLSLALGMLVLGKYYYVYIPILSDLDLYGALILGAVLMIIFMIIGWLYDDKAKLWNESVVIQTERYPYAFVPEFRNIAVEYPLVYSLVYTLRGLFDKLGIQTDRLDSLVTYMDEFYHTSPSNRTDLFKAESKSEDFLDAYPLSGREHAKSKSKLRFGTRIKRSFQIWILRLNYTNSFTGLGQDVLVFAAVYVAIIFPAVAEEGLVPINYLFQGILFMSVPIFIAMVFAGWVYDKRLKLWSPELTVTVERNPYSYVPEPRTYALTFPMFFTLLGTIREILIKKGMEPHRIDEISNYLNEFMKLQVSKNKDMDTSIQNRARLGNIFERSD